MTLSTSPRVIVAFVPNWLGDAVMCTPALRALRRSFPGAELIVAGRRNICELLYGLPWITGFETLPARPGFVEMLRSACRLKRLHADIGVIFPHSFRTAALAWLAGIRHRLGFDRDGRTWLLTDAPVPHKIDDRITPKYMAFEYMDLVERLGCSDDQAGLELAADPERVSAAVDAFPQGSIRIGIAPGAAFGPSKRWLPERFAQVADALREQAGAVCMLLTAPGEEETRDAVQGSAVAPLMEPGVWGSGVEGLKASVSALDLLVSNDSGPRHVAVAFGVPVVCIMGPTSPLYTEGPYERGKVLRVDVDCGPCQKPVCVTDHRCMTQISVERVIEESMALLGPRLGQISQKPV